MKPKDFTTFVGAAPLKLESLPNTRIPVSPEIRVPVLLKAGG
jgi:hypothetical protein